MTKWNCPHCNYLFDKSKEPPREVATVGSLKPSIPHITCPKCKLCMGCEEEKR